MKLAKDLNKKFKGTLTRSQSARAEWVLHNVVFPDCEKYLEMYYIDNKSLKQIAEETGEEYSTISRKYYGTLRFLNAFDTFDFIIDGTNKFVDSRIIKYPEMDTKTVYALARNDIYTLPKLYAEFISGDIYNLNWLGVKMVKTLSHLLMDSGYDNIDDIEVYNYRVSTYNLVKGRLRMASDKNTAISIMLKYA